MRPKRRDQVIRFSRLLLGLVFLAAAATKGVDLTRFVRQNEALMWTIGLPVQPWVETFAWVIAVTVVVVELFISGTLLAGWGARLGAGFGIAALVGFSLVTTFAWLNKLEDTCGCFGAFMPRSAGTAVIENLLLLVPAMFAIRTTKALKIRPAATIWIIVVGVAAMGMFYYYPLSGSALRIGIKPTLPAEVVLPKTGRFFVWLFDPECTKCVDQLRVVQTLTGGGQRIAGVTDATEGRVEEFKLDLNPGFSIVRVSKEEYQKYGVHDGTLIEMKQGRITRLWSGYTLTSGTAALSVGS